MNTIKILIISLLFLIAPAGAYAEAISATTIKTNVYTGKRYYISLTGFNGHSVEIQYNDANGWHTYEGLVKIANFVDTILIVGPTLRIEVIGGSGDLELLMSEVKAAGNVVGSAGDTQDITPVVNAVSTTAFNSRDAATLAASATFQGVSEDVSAYGRAGISITSDNATDGVLTIEVSHDGVIWGGPTRAISDARFSQPVMWNIVEKYFRVKYVNGTTEATNLSIQVQYAVNSDILLAHPLSETLIDEMGAVLTRSVLVGQDVNGIYRNVPVDGEGQLGINVHDQKTRSIDFFFGRLDNATTLSAQADPDDRTITLTSTTGFVDGTRVGIFSADDTDIYYLGNQVGAPAGSVITLDTPIDQEMQISSVVAGVTTNMAVDGSSTTQVFQIGPVGAGSTQVVDLTRIMGSMLDSTAMDSGKFGGITKLTNGIVLRHNNSVIHNIWNAKSNSDLELLCHNFQYADKAPGGQFGASFRSTYAGQGAHGVVLELQPGDFLEVLVQDDLTGLDEFYMMGQGHFKD